MYSSHSVQRGTTSRAPQASSSRLTARSRTISIDRRSRIPTHSRISHRGLQFHEEIPEARCEGMTSSSSQILVTVSHGACLPQAQVDRPTFAMDSSSNRQHPDLNAPCVPPRDTAGPQNIPCIHLHSRSRCTLWRHLHHCHHFPSSFRSASSVRSSGYLRKEETTACDRGPKSALHFTISNGQRATKNLLKILHQKLLYGSLPTCDRE